ncbi:ribosome biogenesis GTPase Der [Roseospira marina]|uniref:GTPase Der n=1 Tax=Roseospira marina TaxID=140057 RepID=A0A5M6IGG7_9PROT|nr:ribosome biogenesis GTPase Der [Roseospira marina]KAA5607314.1 ribosome biogenesis GTPase Der [Roseospira marina]MBB4312527.1 GTP-binding protein [Roseospira marina]MBB5085457.1 GTP-binding protein [Roseospira marina]
MTPLTVAIIGRPNVGKSTLFNRLAGRRLAIVHDRPGVTRDRRFAEGRLGDMPLRIVDTAGLEEAPADALETRMRQQTERALAEADVALMLIDARMGITPMDAHFAQVLRVSPTPVILIANKCEGGAAQAGLYEAFGLGLGDPVPLSAEHGEGLAGLYEALLPHEAALKERQAAEGLGAEADGAADADADLSGEDLEARAAAGADDDADEEPVDPGRPLNLAIVGRPNTGKSTLVNRLIGDDRLLTGPEAGVTRDAITVDWVHKGRPVRLVDTAGMRRKGRVVESLEKLSVADTLNAIRMAEVVVLMMDADMVLDRQDLTIARLVVEEGRALVLAVNKWDAAADRTATMQRLRDRMETSMAQVRGIPYVTLSALKGRNLDRLMDTVLETHAIWNRRVSTGRLNRWLSAMTGEHPPPMGKHGRRLRLRYMTQAKARPPTFAVFCSRPEDLPDSYTRYLVNGLREAFGFEGVPVRLFLRKSENPYAKR